jgi:ubiquinone/menaquinone biosynthesis C-methylase UbiE
MLMNPLDVFMQRNYVYARYRKWWIERAVSRYFKTFIGELTGKRVLEIGCGSGYGAQVIKQFFDPQEVIATDLDHRLISKARSRVVDPSISFEVADASRLPYLDEQYDAIFDFAAIHHIPEWKDCLRELRRVVRSGGRIFLIDSPIESFESFMGRLARIYTSHPYDEMFSEAEFMSQLRELNFQTLLRDVFRPNLYYFVLVMEK